MTLKGFVDVCKVRILVSRGETKAAFSFIREEDNKKISRFKPPLSVKVTNYINI